MLSMSNCCFNVFFISCFLCSSTFLKGQDLHKEFKSDIYYMMKGNSTFQARQETRKFFRILNSTELSEETKSNIYIVLDEFKSRGLYFNSHYIKFFNLFLSCYGDTKKEVVFNDVLDFLILNKEIYTNVQLKSLFFNIEQFVNFNILNTNNSFTWKCVGDYSFSFDLEGNLYFNFSKSDLTLFNTNDTINIFKTDGRYHVINHMFYGTSGVSDFLNEDVFVDFKFNEFTLDLRQQFFQIKNVLMSSVGVVNTMCEGVYNNKLTSSNQYPKFRSYLNRVNSILFNDLDIISAVQMQGDKFFFNKDDGFVDMIFHDDKIEYIFMSDNFILKNSKVSALEAEFVFQNEMGALHHPFVKFSYDYYQQQIVIDRLSGKRGLNPIRNTFHGLNIFADRLEVDLVDDNCLLFHYSTGRDINILFESDRYFDQDRYNDISRGDLDPLGLLIDFYKNKNIDTSYSLESFSQFLRLDLSNTLNLLIELEIFGFVDYNHSRQLFKIKPWAFDFLDSYFGEYDYDTFRVESLAGIGDTIAEIDLYLNIMEIYRVQKMKITNRFQFNIYPMSNRLRFFKDKSFLMDGNIDIGSFAFSGKNIRFDYDNFAFYFSDNSVLSFLNNSQNQISSSLIHFDNAILYVDTTHNKSGKKQLNDFPKFKIQESSFLSYDNNPVVFLIDPFELTYLHDMSLANMLFSGSLYLDGEKSDIASVLSFNSTNNLQTLMQSDSLDLYKGNVNLKGDLFLSEKGLFADGIFSSKYLNFISNKIELLSGEIRGKVNYVSNGDVLATTPFLSKKPALINFHPYDNEFLIKTRDSKLLIYDNFGFLGDIYFDSENLNGSGGLEFSFFNITSSHYYFSPNNIGAADASLVVNANVKKQDQFISKGVSVEYDILDDIVLILKNNDSFSLPTLEYFIDYDFALIDIKGLNIEFSNNKETDVGSLTSLKYGKKKSFTYGALSSNYNLTTNELCVEGGVQLAIKKFWIQPDNNTFCILDNGDFPVFENSTLIKKRWLFKDKLINNKDVIIKPNLKHLIIGD